MQEALRKIPSVDQVLAADVVRPVLDDVPRPTVVRVIRDVLDSVRAAVRAGGGGAAVPSLETIAGEVVTRVAMRPRALRRVLNATGVVLHTNLGRARLAEEAVQAVLEAARGACDLELDLETGKRGSRTRRLEERLVEITGAEAAAVVNNNAGALVLCLNELAQNREAIVSRGELVEIGGSFRLPDVMLRTGARLVEVGTTNRTHLTDYAEAIGPDTALMLKVHRSNFRQEGFVKEPELRELVALGRERDVPVLHDLGSGALHDLAATRREPSLRESLAAGVDVITLSGDKLLGGPQAGILLGRADLLDRMRRNPMARALRVDKFTIAALAATLDLLEDAERAKTRLPVLRALEAPPEELARRARVLAEELRRTTELEVREVAAMSEVGGGAVPAEGLPTTAVALRHATLSAEDLASEFRRLSVPLLGRIVEGEVLLDPRSLAPAEDEECAKVLAERFEGGRGGG